MKTSVLIFACATGLATTAAAPAQTATFHLMQIEQVIGGVNGDTSAQAVQLRMRTGFQNFVQGHKVVAYDANGENPVTIIQFPSNVSNGSAGDRILITSSSFDALTDPATDSDFTMTNLIPASYLEAGRLTFEEGTTGNVLWSLAWGGSNYLGPNTGTRDNDGDGDFGAPWPDPLPSDGVDALRFDGPANAMSTNNADDYVLTNGGSTWTNNARQSFELGDSGGGFSIALSGSCPGSVAVDASGATPNGNVALIFATGTGNVTIPNSFPCAGTTLGLNATARLLSTQRADGAGDVRFSGNAPSNACGGRLQALDVSSCTTSNVIQLQ